MVSDEALEELVIIGAGGWISSCPRSGRIRNVLWVVLSLYSTRCLSVLSEAIESFLG